MEAAPSVLESASARISRRAHRLSGKGIQILKDYYARHPTGGYPSLDVRRQLRDRIRQLPGYEDYPLVNVNTWLQRHAPNSSGASSIGKDESIVLAAAPAPQPTPVMKQVAQEKKTPQPEPPAPAPQQGYPSLSPESTKHLSILAQAQPNPPPEVISTWALLLNATAQDITAWLRANYCPPPSTTPTAAPGYAGSPVDTHPAGQMYGMHTAPALVQPSPTIPLPVRRTAPATTGTPLPLTMSAMRPQLNAAHPLASAAPPPATSLIHARPTVQFEILRNIAQMSLNTPQPGETPRNAEEFKVLFAPYEEKMKGLLQKLA